jgi:hypothetical protein
MKLNMNFRYFVETYNLQDLQKKLITNNLDHFLLLAEQI